MKKILLSLHREENLSLLNPEDAWDFLEENNPKELELYFYIEKWCEYLNWPFLHNEDLILKDADKARLHGWLTGYNAAKKIRGVLKGT